MRDRGILFTPENCRLVESGVKTQTRRVVKPQPSVIDGLLVHHVSGSKWETGFPYICPYGQVGDRLYVKEGVIVHTSIPQLCGYYRDGARDTEPWEKRLTAMFMPKWAARTWLKITDVRVQRLQEISEDDAKAEGATPIYPEFMYPDEPLSEYHYRRGFKKLWDSINGKKYSWTENCWVWAISFKRIQ